MVCGYKETSHRPRVKPASATPFYYLHVRVCVHACTHLPVSVYVKVRDQYQESSIITLHLFFF